MVERAHRQQRALIDVGAGSAAVGVPSIRRVRVPPLPEAGWNATLPRVGLRGRGPVDQPQRDAWRWGVAGCCPRTSGRILLFWRFFTYGLAAQYERAWRAKPSSCARNAAACGPGFTVYIKKSERLQGFLI
jgi:hypothetical protein